MPRIISVLRIAGSIDLLFCDVACCAVRLLPLLEIPIAIVAAIATFAAVQEGHYIRTRKVTKCV